MSNTENTENKEKKKTLMRNEKMLLFSLFPKCFKGIFPKDRSSSGLLGGEMLNMVHIHQPFSRIFFVFSPRFVNLNTTQLLIG